MKRYVRPDNYEKLRYEKDGKVEYLPTWYLTKSDQEIEEAKQAMIRYKHVDRESAPIEFDEQQLYDDLKADGFNKADALEIIAMVASGMTVDSAIQRQLTKSDVHASMDVEDLEDAIMHGKPFESDEFDQYWRLYHQPEEGAITAAEVQVNDIIENTEDASEINLGDTFHVNAIATDVEGWEPFDYEFDVTMLSGDYKGDHVKLHYMADEYVGVRSDVGRALGIYNSTSVTASSGVKISKELRSILEDVMIETLDNYSGSRVLSEFVDNARYLQSWDEYDEEHSEEMLELSRLSNNKLVDIGAEILDEVKAGWQGDES